MGIKWFGFAFRIAGQSPEMMLVNFYPVGRKSMSGFGIKIFAADDRWNSSIGCPPLFIFSEVYYHSENRTLCRSYDPNNQDKR